METDCSSVKLSWFLSLPHFLPSNFWRVDAPGHSSVTTQDVGILLSAPLILSLFFEIFSTPSWRTLRQYWAWAAWYWFGYLALQQWKQKGEVSLSSCYVQTLLLSSKRFFSMYTWRKETTNSTLRLTADQKLTRLKLLSCKFRSRASKARSSACIWMLLSRRLFIVSIDS